MPNTSLKLTRNEKAFVEQLALHENEWVAVVRQNGRDMVVASGKRIGEAKKAAETKGFTEVSFMKVPSSKTVLVPTAFIK